MSSRAVEWGIIIAGLAAVAAVLLIEDYRQEENRATAEAERRAREVPAPVEWPTPLPLPAARYTREGYIFTAPDAEFDPCGSGPMRLISTEDGDEAA